VITHSHCLSAEVLTVEPAGEFRKEIWAMDENEKIALLPELREEGNALYKAGDYKNAAAKYADAIGILEQLLLTYVDFFHERSKHVRQLIH